MELQRPRATRLWLARFVLSSHDCGLVNDLAKALGVPPDRKTISRKIMEPRRGDHQSFWTPERCERFAEMWEGGAHWSLTADALMEMPGVKILMTRERLISKAHYMGLLRPAPYRKGGRPRDPKVAAIRLAVLQDWNKGVPVHDMARTHNVNAEYIPIMIRDCRKEGMDAIGAAERRRYRTAYERELRRNESIL